MVASNKGLDLALQLDARGVELARGDSEADKILGLEPVRSFALLQIPIESALDAAEPHPILPQHFVLFGGYAHPGLVGEDMPFLIRGLRALCHSTHVRLLFAHNVAQFRARRQEKKSSLWPVLLVVVVFYCPRACS